MSNLLGNVLNNPTGNAMVTGNISIIGSQSTISAAIDVGNDLVIVDNNLIVSGMMTSTNNDIIGGLNLLGTVQGNVTGNVTNNIVNVDGALYNNNNLNELYGNLSLPSTKNIKCNKFITTLPTDTLTIMDSSGNLNILGNMNIGGSLDANYINMNKFNVTSNGNTNISGTLNVNDNVNVNTNKFNINSVNGNTFIGGTIAINDNLAINTDKFNVTSTTGNTNITGTLNVMNNININTNKFTVIGTTGNTNTMGTLDVTDNVMVTDKLAINSMTGNTVIVGTLGVNGDMRVNTDKFTIASATGNTNMIGTLNLDNNMVVNTNKFTVDTSGNTIIAGTIGVNNMIVNTNKFIVDMSGNTIIAGTLGVNNMNVNSNKFTITNTGNTLINGTLGVNNNVSVNTNKFTIDMSGNTMIGGNLAVKDIAVNTNKFIVDNNGNTTTAGKIDVSGNMVIPSNLIINGTTTLNGNTINIGTSGSTINILGNANTIQTTELQVNDNLITLNKGGLTSAAGGGIEFEENNVITGYIKIANDRSSYDIKAPNNSNYNTLMVKDMSGNIDISGNITINTNKFNVIGSTGNTTIAGTLNVTNNMNVNTNKFTVAATTGNTNIAGTLGVGGSTNMVGTLATNDINVNTNKFQVNSMGNTTIAGTFDVSGNTNITGNLGINNNIIVNTNKFTSMVATGNTMIAGTCSAKNTTFGGNLTAVAANLAGAINLQNTIINGTLTVNSMVGDSSPANAIYYNTSTKNLNYGSIIVSSAKFTKSATQPASGTNGDQWLGNDASLRRYIDGTWTIYASLNMGYTFPNGDVAQSYQTGVNGIYSIKDHVSNTLYDAYLVHGYGGDNAPWIVIMSCTGVDNGTDFGQSNGSNAVYTVASTDPTANGGNYIFSSFRNYKGAVQTCLATNSLTSTMSTAWVAYNLVMDSTWNTKQYSFWDALENSKNFLASGSYQNNDSVFGTPSTYSITSYYSGTRYAGDLTLTRTQTDGQTLGYFFLYGVNWNSDNDASVLTFANAPGHTNNWGDSWRGAGQLGTKWSYWNNDFHSNSMTQRLGQTHQKLAGFVTSETGYGSSTTAWILVR